MGATVATRAAVAVLRREDGNNLFLGFEEHYEKNCYPHIPHWSAVSVGSYEGLIRRIYASAIACAGGSLQGRNGTIKPETYVRRWMVALKNAYVTQQNLVADLPGRYAEKSTIDQLVSILATSGHVDKAQQLAREGRLMLDLRDPRLSVNTITRLFGGSEEGVGAWRTEARCHEWEWSQERANLSLPKGRVALPSMRAARLFPQQSPSYYMRGLFFSVQDGPMRYYDADYAAMRAVLDAAVASEMISAGSGISVLTAASKIIDEAPLLGEGRVRVDRPMPGREWAQEQYAAACSRVEKDGTDGLEVQTSKMRSDSDLMQALGHLSMTLVD